MSIYLYNLLTFFMVIFFILSFVIIVMWFKKKEGERKTNLLLSALEKGQTIDPELFRTGTQHKSLKDYTLLALLICGTGVSLFAVIISATVITIGINSGRFNEKGILLSALLVSMGVALLIGYFNGKKMLKD